MANRTNAAIPRMAVWTSPGLTGHAGQHGGQGKDGQRQQAADAEQGKGGEGAGGGVGVEPRGGEHAELDGGARRVARRAGSR